MFHCFYAVITLRTKHSCIVIGPVCGGWPDGGRAVSVTTITQNCVHRISPNSVCRWRYWPSLPSSSNFGHPVPREGICSRAEIFGSTLPACSVCVWALFSLSNLWITYIPSYFTIHQCSHIIVTSTALHLALTAIHLHVTCTVNSTKTCWLGFLLLRVSEESRQLLLFWQLWQKWTNLHIFSLLSSERICAGSFN